MMEREEAERLTKDVRRHFKAIQALGSDSLEALARGEEMECAYCGKPLSFPEHDLIVHTLSEVAVFHDVCHQVSEGYGWVEHFPEHETAEAVRQWAEAFLKTRGWAPGSDGLWESEQGGAMELLKAAGEEAFDLDKAGLAFGEGQAFFAALDWLALHEQGGV